MAELTASRNTVTYHFEAGMSADEFMGSTATINVDGNTISDNPIAFKFTGTPEIASRGTVRGDSADTSSGTLASFMGM